jgi:predicted nucleotidyltransferase
MSGFVDRENLIFDVLQAFKDRGLEFVVVGGYAVSAFQHRFSVDADVVIQGGDVNEFTTVLEDAGFEEVQDTELDVYGGRYMAYEKDRELPVTIDLLVNSLHCRQTSASWSYDYFRKHSITKGITGTEQNIRASIPEMELLIAVKLHSGRKTDARDVVALAENIDTRQLRRHLDRGDREKLEEVLDQVYSTVSSDNFQDSFKGVFQQGSLPRRKIQKIQGFIEEYR